MSSVKITKKENKIEITELKNELLYTYYTNNYHDILIVPFSKMQDSYLENHQTTYDEFKEIVKKLDPKIEVIPLSTN